MMSNTTTVHLTNALLASPLTDFGKQHMREVIKNAQMGPDEFICHHYIPPICDDINWRTAVGELNPNQDVDDSGELDKFDPYLEVFRDKVRTDKEKFQNSFLGNKANGNEGLTQSVYILEAVAGSGKTTYAEWLFYQKRDSLKVDKVDFEIAVDQSTYFLGKIFDFTKTTPINSFKLALIKHISQSIPNFKISSKTEFKEKIKKLHNTYNEYFCNESNGSSPDDKEFRGFFDTLKTAYSKPYITFTEEIYQYMSSRVIYPEPTDDSTVLMNLIGILLRLYFCLSRSGLSNGKKYLFFVDNIEWAIMDESKRNGQCSDGFYKPISDDDLSIIMNAVFEASNRLETKVMGFYKGKMHDYKTSFAIMLAMREGTAGILKKSAAFCRAHNQEHSPYSVNISNWYSFKSIIDDKINTFCGIENRKDNLFVEAQNIVMSDYTKSKWALRRVVANAYNQNFRKLAESTFTALSYYPEAVEFFVKMWKEADTLPNSHILYDPTKHLCRKIFLRIILNYIQRVETNDGLRYFSEINSYFSSTVNNHECPYLRRVLTFLSNSRAHYAGGRFVSMAALVSEVLKKPGLPLHNSNVRGQQLKSLANLLGHLSVAGNLQTNWVNLVAIDFCTEKPLNMTINQDWAAYKKSMYKDESSPGARVKITEAGKVFTSILHDFEYFSSRYQPESKPLFMIQTNSELNNLLFKGCTVRGIEYPGIVEKAVESIKGVISDEVGPGGFLRIRNSLNEPQWLFRPGMGNESMIYPRRVITVHKGYLSDFLILLENNKVGLETERDNMKETVKRAISLYETIDNDLIRNYNSYYKMGRNKP